MPQLSPLEKLILRLSKLPANRHLVLIINTDAEGNIVTATFKRDEEYDLEVVIENS
jgi:hypothetical protein